MIRRPRHVRLSATTGVAGSDTDALQTDVMRFMSIIGLCLMAIFALVQGVPLQEPGKTGAVASATAQIARLRETIRSQQQQLQSLQRDADEVQLRLRGLIDQAQQTRVQHAQLKDVLDAVQQQLQQVRQSLDQSRVNARQHSQQLDVLGMQLSDTQQQLDAAHKQLNRLQRQAAQRAIKPEPVKRQAVKKAAPSPVQRVSPTPLPKPDRKPVAPPEKQGFSLRFASDDALDHLIATGQVRLYAMGEQQAWKFSLPGGLPVVDAASQPRWYHEMSAATVPAHFLEVLAAIVGRADAGVTWGVQLPAQTRSAINALTRGRRGGALVIRTDGTVHLQQ